MLTLHNFINHQFIEPTTHKRLPIISPATQEVIGQTFLSSVDDVKMALQSAKRAQTDWKKMTSAQRGDALYRLADAIDKYAAEIGSALAKESGKSLSDANNEAHYAAEITRYHAQWARRIEGEVIPSDSPNENLMLFREPIGVVVALIPFNYPIYTLLRKIAPALITGNSVVVRPSNNTPLSALVLAKAVLDADLPTGLVNILVMNHDIAEVLCTDPAVGMITLTGSVGAGRKVLEYSQVNIAKCSLELGGKTPAIVMADADLEAAAKAIVGSKTTHCGQLCTAVERLYIQESVVEPFMQYLTSALEQVTFGDRAKQPDAMGPLVNENTRINIHQMVERAIDDGAKLIMGGYIPEGKGFFYPPTLLTNVQQNMEIVTEEIFGPVLPVLTFKTADEALALANDHQFGLASVLFTKDYATVMKFSNEIEAGELYINRTPADPYQGYHAGWKRSGLGGDDGKHGMLEFTQTRLVVMKY